MQEICVDPLEEHMNILGTGKYNFLKKNAKTIIHSNLIRTADTASEKNYNLF
jgi:hypothetical protein